MESTFPERRAEALRFLEALFPKGADDSVVSLFALPGAFSLHLPASDLAAVAHEGVQASLEEGANVYVGCCLRRPGITSGRGAVADTTWIPGVWVDLDIAGPAHKSAALPPSRAAALELLDRMDVAPTLVVDSGWGVQAWWLFDGGERRLADDDARERARRLVKGGQEALQRLATPSGWVVDPTAELARVLRLPGTTNWKIEGDPRPVTLIYDQGLRYPAAELVERWAHLVPDARQGPAPLLPERITAGKRTDSVASLAGTMRRRNVVESAALVAALEHNRKVCDPPLPDDKVEETVQGIYQRYAPAEVPRTPVNGVNGKAPRDRGQVKLTPAASIAPEPIRFIWEPGIVGGGLTLLAGDPGMGKGLIVTAITAGITAGRSLPGRQPTEGSVVWISFEESWSYALRPRLDVADADSTRVFRLSIERPDGEGENKFIRADDLWALEETFKAHPEIVLIVLDPVQSFIGAGTDINQSNKVRGDLEPLVDLAERYNVALLGIAHINKSELSKVLYRISNSVAFTALPRSVLGVGELEDGRRVLVHIKSNNTPKFTPIPYRITSRLHPATLQGVGRVVWEDPDEGIDVATVFNEHRAATAKKPSRIMECAESIKRHLADGPRFSSDIKQVIYAEGYAKDTIGEALLVAGVKVTGRGSSARWWPPGTPSFSVVPHNDSGGTESEEPTTDGGPRVIVGETNKDSGFTVLRDSAAESEPETWEI